VLGALVVFTGGGLVRDVYRDVRDAALGMDDCVGSVVGGWVVLLVLSSIFF
jgi:hypothetical protein